MSDTRTFLTAIGVALLAIAAAVWLYARGSVSALEGEDNPGPNLVITVEGEANGQFVIDLLPDLAPRHVQRLVELARTGAYNGVAFHRVIDGFMAQTGDVQYGVVGADPSKAGQGASELPDLAPEFSDVPFRRGVVGMARKARPDTANSQFFIMLAAGEHLNGDYTVVGHVLSGMGVVDQIKKGSTDLNGAVEDPDRMVSVRVEE
ncbi:MAG: peptidylprolyl isomerase [Paracoccaceae bacterium]